MLELAIPSFIKDNVGYILLVGVVLYGMNAVHNHGYEKRNNEVIKEQQAIDKARKEMTAEVNKVLEENAKVINGNFASLEEKLEEYAQSTNSPKQPASPKPPSAPKPPVVTPKPSTEAAEVKEPELPKEPPKSIVLAWEAYELAISGGGVK